MPPKPAIKSDVGDRGDGPLSEPCATAIAFCTWLRIEALLTRDKQLTSRSSGAPLHNREGRFNDRVTLASEGVFEMRWTGAIEKESSW